MNYELLRKTQPRFIKTIDNGFKNNRLSQVYLFDGVKGTPKMLGAMYLANLILCENHNFCGKCIDCRRIQENVHPRIFYVSPENLDTLQSIKVDQIERLIEEFSYTGLEYGTRIFIIDGIEKANPAAANKLLKFLEEMKEDSYGILITSDIDKVLETIKSRSQIIHFDKLKEDNLLKEYLDNDVSFEDAHLLAKFTNDLTEGLETFKSDNYKELLAFAKQLFINLFTSKNLLILAFEQSRLLSLSQDIYTKLFFDIFVQIVNDYLVGYLLKAQNMIFTSLFQEIENKEEIKELNTIISKEKAYDIITMTLDYKQKLNSYVNRELLFIDYFASLEQLRSKK